MPLVVVCGQPCSGKSGVAGALAALLQARSPHLKVVIVDEEGLHLDRNASYRGMLAGVGRSCCTMM
jgi:protein KTI12